MKRERAKTEEEELFYNIRPFFGACTKWRRFTIEQDEEEEASREEKRRREEGH